ncbi:glycosyltransferase family 2 protein [Thiomicrorhabdus sp.]|uniref:glycosyltransferase family 2 protein n=1 Tax=Thiomicrorhabdus sp. TaxID=2039724 RepID=UPI0029C9577A|nr:glycosyltransferase family 2 protein [Thiomicrorhabdus sp.]
MEEVLSSSADFSTTRRLVKNPPTCENSNSLLFISNYENASEDGGLRKKGYFKSTTSDEPLLTVITVIFNGQDFLEETILSVINQPYSNVEYIIVDGGSKDGTLNIIKKYEYAIDYWVSEKDSGIYDAMNKGLSLASGRWINFMNAGDSFLKGKLEIIMEVLKNSSESVVYFNAVDLDGRVVGDNDIKCIRYDTVGVHQGFFIDSSVHKSYPYDLDYRIKADREFFVKIYLKNYKFKYCDINVCLYDLDGISGVNIPLKEKENIRINLKYKLYTPFLVKSILKIILHFVWVKVLKNDWAQLKK